MTQFRNTIPERGHAIMAKKDQEPNLLDEIEKDGTAEVQTEVDDLLGEIDETNATVWRPDLNSDGADDNQPVGLQGTVLAVGEGPFGYEGALIPWVEIRDAAGKEWVVRGYGNVLIDELHKAAPRRGGTFAVKYFGRKEPKKAGGKKYHHYKAKFVAAAEPAPAAAPAAATRTPFGS